MAGPKFIINSQLRVVEDRLSTEKLVNDLSRRFGNINAVIKVSSRQVETASGSHAQNIATVTTRLTELEKKATGTTSLMKRLGEEMGGYFIRFSAFSLAASTVFTLLGKAQKIADETLAFDSALVKISQTLGVTRSSLRGLTDEIFLLSSTMGASSDELANASLTLAQAGFTAEDTSKALRTLAQTAVSPSFNNMENTVKGMIAVMNQFNLTVDQMQEKFSTINEVSKKYAIESEDIVTATRIAGSTFALSSKELGKNGQAFEKFISLFTAVRDTTQESASTIATALKTIGARLQAPSTVDFLEKMGIRGIRDEATGEFAGIYESFQAISRAIESQKISTLSPEFAQLVEVLGGKRQYGKVQPAIAQFAKAEEALAIATFGSNSLLRDQLLAQDGLTIAFNKTKESFKSLAVSLTQDDQFRQLITSLNTLIQSLSTLGEAFKDIIPYLGIIGSVKLGRYVSQLGSGLGSGISNIIAKRNTGGYLPGNGFKDDVPAMLTKGEYVIKKPSVQRLGLGNLDYMNRHGKIPGFNRGGFVSEDDLIGNTLLRRVKESNIDLQDVKLNTYSKLDWMKQLEKLGLSENASGYYNPYGNSVNFRHGVLRGGSRDSIFQHEIAHALDWNRFEGQFDSEIVGGSFNKIAKKLAKLGHRILQEDPNNFTARYGSYPLEAFATAFQGLSPSVFLEQLSKPDFKTLRKGYIWAVTQEFIPDRFLPRFADGGQVGIERFLNFDKKKVTHTPLYKDILGQMPNFFRQFAPPKEKDTGLRRFLEYLGGKATDKYNDIFPRKYAKGSIGGVKPLAQATSLVDELIPRINNLGQVNVKRPKILMNSETNDLLDGLGIQAGYLNRSLLLHSNIDSDELQKAVQHELTHHIDSSLGFGNFITSSQPGKEIPSKTGQMLRFKAQGLATKIRNVKGIAELLKASPNVLSNLDYLSRPHEALAYASEGLSASNYVKALTTGAGLNRSLYGFVSNRFDEGTGFNSIVKSIFANKFETGGYVAKGSGSKDDVPALLKKGEFVVNDQGVKNVGIDFLHNLNTGKVTGFAKGSRKKGSVEPDEYTVGPIVGKTLEEALRDFEEVTRQTKEAAQAQKELALAQRTSAQKFRDNFDQIFNKPRALGGAALSGSANKLQNEAAQALLRTVPTIAEDVAGTIVSSIGISPALAQSLPLDVGKIEGRTSYGKLRKPQAKPPTLSEADLLAQDLRPARLAELGLVPPGLNIATPKYETYKTKVDFLESLGIVSRKDVKSGKLDSQLLGKGVVNELYSLVKESLGQGIDPRSLKLKSIYGDYPRGSYNPLDKTIGINLQRTGNDMVQVLATLREEFLHFTDNMQGMNDIGRSFDKVLEQPFASMGGRLQNVSDKLKVLLQEVLNDPTLSPQARTRATTVGRYGGVQRTYAEYLSDPRELIAKLAQATPNIKDLFDQLGSGQINEQAFKDKIYGILGDTRGRDRDVLPLIEGGQEQIELQKAVNKTIVDTQPLQRDPRVVKRELEDRKNYQALLKQAQKQRESQLTTTYKEQQQYFGISFDPNVARFSLGDNTRLVTRESKLLERQQQLREQARNLRGKAGRAGTADFNPQVDQARRDLIQERLRLRAERTKAREEVARTFVPPESGPPSVTFFSSLFSRFKKESPPLTPEEKRYRSLARTQAFGYGALALTQLPATNQFLTKTLGEKGAGVAQSALGLGITGAFIGGEFGQAPGAVIGGLVGVVGGIVSSLSELDKALAERKITKGIAALNKVMESVKVENITSRSGGGVIDKNVKDYSIAVDALLNNTIKSMKEVDNRFNSNTATIGRKISQWGVFFKETSLEGTPSTFALLKAESVVNKNAKEEADQEKQGIAAQVSGAIVSDIQERTRRGLIANFDDLKKQYGDNYGKLIQTLQVGGSKDGVTKTKEEIEKLLKAITNLPSIIRKATESLDGFEIGLQKYIIAQTEITNRFKSVTQKPEDILTSGSTAGYIRRDQLSNLGNPLFNRTINQIPTGDVGRSTLSQINNALQVLPKLINETELGDPKDFAATLGQNVVKTFGDGDISQVIRDLIDLRRNNEDDRGLIELKTNPYALGEDVKKRLEPFLSAEQASIDALADFKQSLIDTTSEVYKLQNNFADASSVANSLGLEISQRRRRIEGLIPTSGGSELNFLEDISNRTGGATSVESIAASIETARVDLARTEDARYVLTIQKNIAALEKFKDVTTRTADVQARLAALESSRSAKLSLAEKLFTAEGPEKRRGLENAFAARAFVATGARFEDLNRREQLSVVGGLRDIGEGLIGEKTGNQIAAELFGKLSGYTGSEEDLARKGEEDKIIAAYDEAKKAADVIAEQNLKFLNEFTSKTSEVTTAFLTGVQAAEKYKEATTAFNASFGANILQLNEATNKLAGSKIHMEATHNVIVTFNGAEVLKGMEPTIKGIAIAAANKAVSSAFKEKLGGAGLPTPIAEV